MWRTTATRAQQLDVFAAGRRPTGAIVSSMRAVNEREAVGHRSHRRSDAVSATPYARLLAVRVHPQCKDQMPIV